MADKNTVDYIATEKQQKAKYYTVGDLRQVLSDLPDSAPVVAAPISKDVKVALDIAIAKEGELADYKGKIAIFSVGLFDIATGKEINLVPAGNE